MANGTRSAARGSEAPEPQVSTGQQVPPAPSTIEAELAAANRKLELAEVLEKISQSNHSNYDIALDKRDRRQ
ncbi:hypothetical protein E4U45_008050 [Claviceps purpurea]|nr:hypothetical protein E4U45_008050 [Claviceps purpurea]